MYIEAKKYAPFTFVFNLVSLIFFGFWVYFVMIPFMPESGMNEFRLFLIFGGAVMLIQLFVYLFLAIKGKVNEHLMNDGVECETELMGIKRGRRNNIFYTFHVECKYKTQKGEYHFAKSSVRYLKKGLFSTQELNHCIPKVYVDAYDDSKYYVSVLVQE